MTTSLSKKERRARRLFLRGGGVCFYHGGVLQPPIPMKASARRFHIATRDHVIPKHEGGLSNDENIVLACEACNTMKGGMPAEAFMIFCNMVAARHPRPTKEETGNGEDQYLRSV